MADRMRRALAHALRALRDVCVGAAGAHAYANYLAHLRAHHPGEVPLTRAAFARRAIDDRWSGVTRCC